MPHLCLKYPSATLLPVMGAHAAGFLQMSPASYQRWGKEEVRLHPVGTGPFKLANWEQNRVIVLEKNPHYFKPGLPYLDRVELRIIKEGVTRVTALPTIATILKTQYAKLGVDVTVEVLDRPIFLRRWQRDRDWDQILGVSGAAFDSYQLSRVLDTRAGNNTLNHDDKQVNALIDRMEEVPTEAALLQAGYDFQRYVMEQMMTCGIASLPFLQAARADVKGDVHLHGYKIPFETTWHDRP